MPFVSNNCDIFSDSVTVVLYVLSYFIGLCYNGTWLYVAIIPCEVRNWQSAKYTMFLFLLQHCKSIKITRYWLWIMCFLGLQHCYPYLIWTEINKSSISYISSTKLWVINHQNGPNFNQWLSKVSANGRRHYSKCNIFHFFKVITSVNFLEKIYKMR